MYAFAYMYITIVTELSRGFFQSVQENSIMTSFHILPNFLFTDYAIIQCHVIEVLKMPLSK
jgi:hypothetical protein